MKAKTQKLLAKCIEDGINYGWRKAHKHTDTPTEEEIKRQITYGIELEVAEWFDFEEGDKE